MWQQTTTELLTLINNREQTEHVFLNRCKEPLTRFGIHILVKKYGKIAIATCPSLEKNVLAPMLLDIQQQHICYRQVLISILSELGLVMSLLIQRIFMQM